MVTTHGDDWWARLREDDDVDGADDSRSWLDLRSRALERQVLDYVRSHMVKFRDPSTKHYLDLMPEEHDERYAERFRTGDLWMGLLHIVQHALGPAFRPVWQDSISERVGADDGAHQPQSEMHHKPPASAITRAICGQLGNIPEVKENPALRGVYASGELGAYIDHAVVAWASDRCRKAVENNESDDGDPWSSEALQTIQVAYQGYERILAGMTSATAISERDDDDQQRQLPSLLPPEERISHVPNDVPRQQGAVASNHHMKQPPSSQGFVPVNAADRVQRESGRTGVIAIEEGLLLRKQQQQQQQQQRQPSRYPQQQAPSSPPFASNVTTAMPSVPPAQGAATRSPRHRDGKQVTNAVDYGYQPPPQKSYVAAEVGRSLQKLPKEDVGGGRVNRSPTTRITLPNGRPSPSQSHAARTRQPRQHRRDHIFSSRPHKGPVATSGSRR
jgi:hypothetical protein